MYINHGSVAVVGPRLITYKIIELVKKIRPGVYKLSSKTHAEDVSSFYGVILVFSSDTDNVEMVTKNIRGAYFKCVPIVSCFIDWSVMKGQGEFSFDIDRVDLENLDSLKDVSNIKLGKSIKRI